MALIPAIGAAVIGARAATKAASRGRKFDSFEDALRWAKGKLDEIVGRGDGAAPLPGGTPTPGGPLVPSDPDFAIGQIASGGNAKASDLADWGVSNGWTRTQTANGPIKFVDENGVTRLTIKKGSSRAPGSSAPHIEIRNVDGQRVDVYGNTVTRKSPGNHTPIVWDLES